MSTESRRTPARGAPIPRLWLIADAAIGLANIDATLSAIAPAIEGCPGLVGLIERDHGDTTDRARLRRLEVLRDRATRLGLPLWVNRRPDLAMTVAADGVQLTSRSASVADVRRAFPTLAIARSCHGAQEAQRAADEEAAFVLYSPIFAPLSKAPDRPPVGLTGLSDVARKVGCPVIALGGASPDRTQAMLDAGAHGVATIGGLFTTEHPFRMATAYFALLRDSRHRGDRATQAGAREAS